MTWNGKGATADEKKDNSKAVLVTLTTSLVSGKKVNLYGLNDGRQGQYIHLVK
jgi:hypothetical protein